jgi:DNA integrity scanning protein DisA with diadenylate cyclase activity
MSKFFENATGEQIDAVMRMQNETDQLKRDKENLRKELEKAREWIDGNNLLSDFASATEMRKEIVRLRKELHRRIIGAEIISESLQVGCLKKELDEARAFIIADYNRYFPYHPYARELLSRYPWLVEQKEENEQREQRATWDVRKPPEN